MSDEQHAEGESAKSDSGAASDAPAVSSSHLSSGITPLSPTSRDAAKENGNGGEYGTGSGERDPPAERERSRSPERDERRADSASDAPASSGATSARVSHRKSARKVYVGNLAATATEKDVMDLFAHSAVPCALPAQVDMKQGYAFVHFDETNGVDDAVARLNGADLLGAKVRVELSKTTTTSRCYTCGMEGHWSRDCPHARGRAPYPSSSTSSSSRYGASSSSSRYDPYYSSSSRRSRSPDQYARRRSPPSSRYDPYARPRSPPRYDRAASPGRDRGYYDSSRDDRGGRGGYDRGSYGGGGGGSSSYYGGGSGGYSGGYGASGGSGGYGAPPPAAGGGGYGSAAYPPAAAPYSTGPPASHSRGGYY